MSNVGVLGLCTWFVRGRRRKARMGLHGSILPASRVRPPEYCQRADRLRSCCYHQACRRCFHLIRRSLGDRILFQEVRVVLAQAKGFKGRWRWTSSQPASCSLLTTQKSHGVLGALTYADLF
ncbi:hypothetical protein BDW68DRAFT_34881 [Aspergillus falconensis]